MHLTTRQGSGRQRLPDHANHSSGFSLVASHPRAGAELNRRHQDFQSPHVLLPSTPYTSSSSPSPAVAPSAQGSWKPIPTDAVLSLGPSKGRVAGRSPHRRDAQADHDSQRAPAGSPPMAARVTHPLQRRGLAQAEAGTPAVETCRKPGSASRPSGERLAELRIWPAAGGSRIYLIPTPLGTQ